MSVRPKDAPDCPICGEWKDHRAKHCMSCRKQPRPKEGVSRLLPTLGYKYIMLGGKCVLEHRHVMEQHLGRKLGRKEHAITRMAIKLTTAFRTLSL
jgi:hypothetical protein